MPHQTPLISTIVMGLVLAFLLGALAQRIKVSPLVGYLLAGVAIGPFTPGFVGDQDLANQLAEIGVILLMFGVGLHFSLQDLLSVRAIAIPGAMVQIASATLLGMGLAWLMGWSIGAGLVFGLALSVASTVVLLRALQDRRLVNSERGRIAVGWLIVEDIAMVLTLVLLPALAPLLRGDATSANLVSLGWPIALTLAKVAAFVVLMLIIGRRVIPWILHYVAHTGSRELFRLSVLALALGVAYAAATLFGASFALGAFFAGMILGESQLSQRAAQETLPLRDAFAVLFFVSVGMLFNPAILIEQPGPLAATVLIIVLGKSIAAYSIVRMFGHSNQVALTISASLAQIGEFSFILAGLGVSLALLPELGRDLILGGALLSIMLNPVFFAAMDWMTSRGARAEGGAAPIASSPDAPASTPQEIPRTSLVDHVVLIGHGRVGRTVSASLIAKKMRLLVVENEESLLKPLTGDGVETIAGNAADPAIMRALHLEAAHCLLVAIPDAFEGGQVVEQARAINPSLRIIARSHSDEETQHLLRHGASLVVMGETEIAKAMIADAIEGFEAPGPMAP
jgi:CPA2 family monovalent cation:H+ antiporter-2